MIARDYYAVLLLFNLDTFGVKFRFFLYFKVNKLLENIKQAIFLQSLFPKMRSCITMWIIRISRTTIISSSVRTLVERQEGSGQTFNLCCHHHVAKINGKKGNDTIIEFERFFARVSVLSPLTHGIFDVLASELIL